MRRVLIVAYYFPPLGGIGSVRMLEFARRLPEFGWHPTVLAPAAGAYFSDPSLSFPEKDVIRTPSLEISRLAKRVASPGTADTEELRVGRLTGTVQRLVRRYLYHPDAQIGWYPFARRAALRAVSSNSFDAVFSSSFPITSHLVARCVRRRTNLPWLAEFRDPWVDAMQEADPRRPRAARLERALVRDADGVVAPSPFWEGLYRAKGALRSWVITNGFDPADFPAARAPVRPVITHLGSLYPELQDLSAMWKALAHLRANGKPSPRLEFVGELDPRIRAQLIACGLSDAFDVTGFLPHRQAVERVASAAVLLVAGARDASGVRQGVIPGKLFEYLGSGRPIIYVGAKENDGARLLRGMPACHVLEPDDKDGVERGLREALADAEHEVKRDASGFTRAAISARLAGALESISETFPRLSDRIPGQ